MVGINMEGDAMELCAYRNLNIMKKYGKSVFVWSVCEAKGNGRGLVIGYIVPEGMEHTVEGKVILGNEITLVDQRAICSGALASIIRDGVRSVAAWNIGTQANDVPSGVQREFTMNPLPISKGGRADTTFMYADDKTTPVNWNGVKAVTFNSKGAFLIR
jgi:hypothetical protein